MKRIPGYTEEQIDNDAVLLRAYGRGTEVLIDRESMCSNHTACVYWSVLTEAQILGETTSHSLLSKSNLAPPLLARFQNGLLYRFIRGRACNPEDLSREAVWRGVAQRLAQWHAVLPVSAENQTAAVIQRHGDSPLSLPRLKSSVQDPKTLAAVNAITPGKATPNIWTVMQKWIFALPSSTEAEATRNISLQKELERTAKDLADRPGLGKDGVWSHSTVKVEQLTDEA